MFHRPESMKKFKPDVLLGGGDELAMKLSPKDERLAQEVYTESVERMMPLWKMGLSPAAIEESKRDALKHARMLVQKYGAQFDCLARIYKLLKKSYGEEFAQVVFEIEAHTATNKELTDLTIQIQNMLQQGGSTQDKIKKILEPVICRNATNMQEQLSMTEKVRENIEQQITLSEARIIKAEAQATEDAKLRAIAEAQAAENARLRAIADEKTRIAEEYTQKIAQQIAELQGKLVGQKNLSSEELMVSTSQCSQDAVVVAPSMESYKRKKSDTEQLFDLRLNNTEAPPFKKKL